MTEQPKKQGFLGRTARLFTREDRDVYEPIHFQEPEQAGDETWPALECPDSWSAEAVELLSGEAACRSIPVRLKTIEENTVPSWLWRHSGQGTARTEEFSVRHIFDRAVGSATYTGWKQDLFADESEARIFFDEARAMLMQRFVAIEPREFASLGLGWAYGMEERATQQEGHQSEEPPARAVDISNATIDAIVRGVANKAVRARWQKLWPGRTETSPVTLRLSDIATDWNTSSPNQGVRAAVDLMAFRHIDGWVNIDALRHAVRLTVILLDLHGGKTGQRLDIGFSNLAPLLMALALPYDGDAARSIAAAISAIVTAEAYVTSAELAGLRGPGADFVANRETVLRVLRNQRRAAYGDRNDYEKISVLPVPLTLEHSPDLALVAVAQRRWEDVLSFTRQHGLRHTQVTTLTVSPALALFMESTAQGIAPVGSLKHTRSTSADLFRQEINPSVAEALTRLGYDQAASRSILKYIAGTGTLDKAPVINRVALRGHGFDEVAIQRVEDYLPYVNDIRLAFTPWIVGEEFCRKVLKIPASKLQNSRFELLRHFGFSIADIMAANAFCYGHGTARGAKDIRQQHAGIFARADEISPEARIRMAAAVQGFISGDAGLALALSPGNSVERNESLLLTAWRQGVKSVTIIRDISAPVMKNLRTETAAVQENLIGKKPGKKLQTSAFLHTQQPGPLPVRRLKPKAGSGLVSLGRGRPKPSSSIRGKRS